MKYSKRILVSWIGGVVMTVLLGGVALYDNACQGRAKAKEVAIQSLRSVAERVVTLKFEELEKIYVSVGNSHEKYPKRTWVSETGKYEVEVDSLKETQGLYPLEGNVAFKAHILNCYKKFPLEQIYKEWKDEMNARYEGAECALSLKVHSLENDSIQEKSVGEKTVIALSYDLGTYYLDSMYTMQLTVYTWVGFWACVDGTTLLLCVLSGLLLLLVLVGGVFYVVRFRKNEKKEIPHEVTTTYRIGECIFDPIHHTLTYREKTMACTPQPAKLLLGFVKTPDFFLSNEEIVRICGWSSEVVGINERRRTAIGSVKKLLAVDKSVQIQCVRERNGYQIVILPNSQVVDS